MADFNLGRIRFVWKGAWQAATAYVRDDVVSNGDSSYVCITAHTSGANFSDNADKFEVMAAGSSATPTTTKGDIVYHDGTGDERLPIGSTGQALFVDANGVPVWAGVEEAEATYYVTTGGSDSNNGQTLNSAFKTIKHAVSQITGPANLFVKTGTFYEQLPIDIPEGVALVGDGQRTTEIQPIYIVATGADVIATSGADTSTTIIVQDAQTTGNEWQVNAKVTGTSITGDVTISSITPDTPLAGFTTLTVAFTSQTVANETITLTSDYRNETMFRMGDSSMLHKVLMKGLTGFTPNLSAPTDITQATVAGVYVALDPNSPIANKSPYVIECSCFSTGGVGAVVDGTIHNSGNRSIVFHAYTMINDDGVGLWVNGSGKAEAVSCFTYFAWIGYTTTNGGKIRSLSGNNSYGTYGVVSTGSHPTESTNDGALHGEQLAIESVSGTFGVGNTITSNGGATGTVLNVQQDKVYYLSTGGTFQAGETITDNGSGATATISTGGVTGQQGFILLADGFSAEPLPGGSVSISGDSNYYIIQSVSGTYVDATSVMTILLANEKVTPSANDATVSIIYEYSQARLTGHDFLSIGTGSKADTNYPGAFNQAESQANEVVENLPGRVFYVSTDQDGNFRVGDYFKVDQATGRATLNASAFDLSGLTSLRLGAIGAQLGELVDEFSSDSTLSGNSNTAVPTEAATRGYFTQVATNIVPVTDDNLTLGTPTKRWQEVYVGPGSVNIGTLKISETAGTFTVTDANDIPAPVNVKELDTGNIRLFQNNIIGNNSNEDIEITASGTGKISLNSDVELSGELHGPATFTIDPAAIGDDTGTVIIKGNFQVDGTTTTINSTTLAVDDLKITLASGAADAATADGAGITVDGANADLTYRSSGDKWEFNKPLDMLANNITTTGTGTVATLAVTDGSITLGTADTSSGHINAYELMTFNIDIDNDDSDTRWFGWYKNASSGGGSSLMRLTEAGDLHVGKTATGLSDDGVSLHANGTLEVRRDLASANVSTVAYVSRGSTDGNIIQFYRDTTQVGEIGAFANTLYFNGSSGGLMMTNAIEPTDGSQTRVNNSIDLGGNSYRFKDGYFAGTLYAAGGFVESSSIALKENVNPLTGALEVVNRLAAKVYDRKDGSRTNEPGFIAEEVAEIIPNVVTENKDGIHYSKLTAYLVEAVKDLTGQVDALKEEIKNLRNS